MIYTMSATDRSSLINHVSMFGAAAVCRKVKSGWIVDWRDHGFPMVFKTKKSAIDAVDNWVLALAHREG